MEKQSIFELKKHNVCIIVPTYNNQNTIERVLNELIIHTENTKNIFVINDGCTDQTPEILKKFESQVNILNHEVNQGKGKALQTGIKKAIELNYQYALTIDSDGQHYPEDIPLLLNALENEDQVLVMGSRNMEQEGVPGKSSFGNKFSNFWFLVETGWKLPDTQTGFRIYPLKRLKNKRFFTKKFEFEIEIIVRLAWQGAKIIPVPIRVKYDPNERVSHFRPGRDFFRISVLNSILVIIALLTYYPKKFFSKNTLLAIKNEAIKSEESNQRKALSIGFGFFMGIIPLWGFQLLIGIPLAIFFKLNKVLFITAANISIPPMIPFILFFSTICGQILLDGQINTAQLTNLSLEGIQNNFKHYFIGAIVFAILAGVIGTLLSWLFLRIFRKEKKKS